jgi:hypothetical protein
MLYDIPAALKAATETIGKVFDFKKTAKEHQAESEILKDDSRKVKAIKYADEALEIVESNNGYLSYDDFKRFRKLKEKFDDCKIN